MGSSKEIEIQVLRSIAALEVVIWHSDTVIKYFSPIRVVDFGVYQKLGGIGVEIFFWISGFIMAMLIPVERTGAKFLVKRTARIVPLYWFFTGLVLLASSVNPAWNFGDSSRDLITVIFSLVIFPQEGYPTLGVGWTLEHEMLFYIVCAVSIFFAPSCARKWTVFFLCMILYFIGLITNWKYFYHFTSNYWIIFAAGIFCQHILREKIDNQKVMVYFSAALLCAGLIFYPEKFRIISTILLIGFVYILCGRSKAVRFWSKLELIGALSFSLYLSHGFILSLCGKILSPFVALNLSYGQTMAADVIARTSAVLLCIFFASIFYKYVEAPLNLRVKQAILGSAKA